MRITLRLTFILVCVIAAAAIGFSAWQARQEEVRLKHELERRAGIIADSLSGVSGAGRKAELDYLFVEDNDGNSIPDWPALNNTGGDDLTLGEVHQISEIMPVKGVTLVGTLPKEFQKLTVYSAGVAAKSISPDLARAFIAFVTRPSIAERNSTTPVRSTSQASARPSASASAIDPPAKTSVLASRR